MNCKKSQIIVLSFLICFLLTGCLPQAPKHKIMHANINCSDFETSKRFYQMLGFTVRIETDVNIETEEEAAGLSMPPYSLHAAPMALKDGFVVDLIQWIGPYDPEAPYELINHLGLTHLSLKTTDLDADMATLAAAGVEFLSAPVTIDRPVAGSRLVGFKDPDGTLIELIELGNAVPGALNICGTHITGSLQTNVNCSNLEESRDFYELFGLNSQEETEYVGSPDLAAAVGLDSYHVREARMMMDKGSSLTLTEWENPYDSGAPYALLNHLGIPRIAIQTTNLEADIERLTAEGIEFYSNPITPEPPLNLVTYVCFEDPDGTVIELVKCNNIFACAF